MPKKSDKTRGPEQEEDEDSGEIAEILEKQDQKNVTREGDMVLEPEAEKIYAHVRREILNG